MADLGKAYVQIVPSAKGISGQIQAAMRGEADAAGEEAGQNFGSKFVSVAKRLIAAAGLGKFISDSLNAGGALQQSFGGIDTLYGEAAEAAKNYSMEAARAGISANTYAEQAVSFGASLKQAFGGDTTAAMESANQAILDMADNSAKFGTDITSIQNAYQGFAKQNYTMLDNLKLGYGGTKTEMERLLEDAEKLTGIHYDIENLGDVYSAIHAIQEDLNIAGVAAEEASTTFTGSMQAMKASAENLMAALSLGMDISPQLNALVESTSAFLFGNLFPMIGNVLTQIPSLVIGVVQGIAQYMDEFINTGIELVVGLVQGVITSIPQLVSAAGELVESVWNTIQSIDWKGLGLEIMGMFDVGIFSETPEILNTILEIVTEMIGTIMQNLPQFLSKGSEIILSMITGIINNLPGIIQAIFQVVSQLISTISQNLPQFITQGLQAITNLAIGLIQAIPKVVAAIPQIIQSAVQIFKSFDWIGVGTAIISGIVNGIWAMAGAIGSALMQIAKNALGAIKSFFGIASPSKLMADAVGKYIPMGMAEGIEDNAKYVKDAMESMAADAVNMPLDMSMTTTAAAGTPSTTNTTNYGGVVININASDYEDPRSLAEYIKDYLTNGIIRDSEVFA